MVDYAQPSKPPNWDRRLREVHPKLSTEWNRKQRIWEIWYDRDYGMGKILAMKVGDGVNYRELGEDILNTLRAGDTHRIGLKRLVEMIDAEDERYLQQLEKDRENVSEAIAGEMADHSRLIQKPLGVVTEKEVAKPASKIITPAQAASD